MNNPADVQAAFCSVLVDEWARAGVTDAVVSPGSRSTPLVIALDADPRVRVHVVLDERSAGFVALGIGLASGRPAVVATTSGTASVELHPAVVEAHHAGVPLIAATADRPPELHHVGAPQTVEQESLFAGALRWAVAPGVADAGSTASWRSLGSRCVAVARGASPGGPGPVHLNLAFREPLLGDGGAFDAPAGRKGGAPWHASGSGPSSAATADVVDLLAGHAGGRGLVVAGAGCGDPAALVAAAKRLGWPVLADPRSGCRRGVAGGAVVAAADSLLRVGEFAAAARPDIVVSAGAPWASKVLSQWLAGLPESVPQVLADPWGLWPDPERRASHSVAVDGAALLTGVTGSGAGGEWARRWADADTRAQEALDGLLGTGGDLEMSEPAVARAVLTGAPASARVLVSSSMPVRDAEWFGPPAQAPAVLSNRGANGIDGVLSTAVGVALADGRPAVALLGDLAFLYDAGALLWAKDRDVSLLVVVVDNDGGGIFSFLPQASAMPAGRFEKYWGTPHGVDLVSIAEAYGARGVDLKSRAELDSVVAGAGAGAPGVTVAVLRSDREDNVAVHDRLNYAVAGALSR